MEREFRLNWPILVEEAVRRRHKLNLTQQQLAALAKVSTPTVSRFEQAENNIQLSTVLALLDVLGMTDKRTLIFPNREFFPLGITDGVTFWGQDGAARVRCMISREALDDHFSERGRLRPNAAFEKHRPQIEAFARRKYLLGQTEPDGSILIRTGDLI
jgi:transcriptional regulator with XRE-family HTH domain